VSWSEWAARPFEIAPSLYAADFARLGEQLDALLDAGARLFHFDMGDGHFIPEVTIGPVVLASISERVHERGGVLDCHLMVDEPERHFESIGKAGGDSVTFHVEAVDDPARTVAAARGLGLGVGVAFKPGTPVETAARAAGEADVALCMSIEPGYSGQAFMPEAFERIEALRTLLPSPVRVQVDGGISAANVRAVNDAGANLVVAGSAVFWDGDPPAAYGRLVAAAGGVQ
jgi:ribulose-phosphate 3-epimerase